MKAAIMLYSRYVYSTIVETGEEGGGTCVMRENRPCLNLVESLITHIVLKIKLHVCMIKFIIFIVLKPIVTAGVSVTVSTIASGQ